MVVVVAVVAAAAAAVVLRHDPPVTHRVIATDPRRTRPLRPGANKNRNEPATYRFAAAFFSLSVFGVGSKPGRPCRKKNEVKQGPNRVVVSLARIVREARADKPKTHPNKQIA